MLLLQLLREYAISLDTLFMAMFTLLTYPTFDLWLVVTKKAMTVHFFACFGKLHTFTKKFGRLTI